MPKYFLFTPQLLKKVGLSLTVAVHSKEKLGAQTQKLQNGNCNNGQEMYNECKDSFKIHFLSIIIAVL
jgi:hypothetical protein